MPSEYGRAEELVGISEGLVINDQARWRPIWTVTDFRDPDDRVARAARGLVVRIRGRRVTIKRGLSLDELKRKFPDRFLQHQSFPGNLLLNEGINELWTLVAGTGATKFDTAAYTGVGDSATAAAAAQTGLQAVTNKLYKAMDGGYPIYGTSQKVTYRSTYATGDANWDWNEFTVANGNSDAAKNLNRKVQASGTKTSAFSRILTLDITLA